MEINMFRVLLTILLMLFCVVILISCITFVVTYGRTEAPIANIVGKNLRDFVEHEKTGEISIENMDYTLIYRKHVLRELEPPERPTRGNYSFFYLAMKKLSNDAEEVIIHEGRVERAVVDRENQLLFFMDDDRYWSDNRTIIKYYLTIYDLAAMQPVDRIMVLDMSKYQEENIRNVAHITSMVFNYNENKLLFIVRVNRTGVSVATDYLSLNISTGEVNEIPEEQYTAMTNYLHIQGRTTFIANETTMRLFWVAPSGNSPLNSYKPRYWGLYINDGTSNIRISRQRQSPWRFPIWLGNGRYVVFGPYLFDTAGRLTEVKIADGEILTIF